MALLLRRVRELLVADAMQCVGTSATLAGRGTWTEQREEVARLATRLFGDEVAGSDVIGETLERVTAPIDDAAAADLAALRCGVIVRRTAGFGKLRPARGRPDCAVGGSPDQGLPSTAADRSQTGFGDLAEPPTLTTASLWTFRLVYSHEHAAQDHVALTVEFNLSPPPPAFFAEDPDDLFAALAQYVAVADDLNGLLTGLTDAGRGAARILRVDPARRRGRP